MARIWTPTLAMEACRRRARTHRLASTRNPSRSQAAQTQGDCATQHSCTPHQAPELLAGECAHL